MRLWPEGRPADGGRDDLYLRHGDPGRDRQEGPGRLRSHRHRPLPDPDHLVTIPVTNTSVNPARSTGVALFGPEWALPQLWLFWVAPIIGAVIAGPVYRMVAGDDQTT